MGIRNSKEFNINTYFSKLYNKILKCNIVGYNKTIQAMIYYKKCHILSNIKLLGFSDFNPKLLEKYINKNIFIKIISYKDNLLNCYLNESKNNSKENITINKKLKKKFYRPPTPYMNAILYSYHSYNIPNIDICKNKVLTELKQKISNL